MVPGAGRRPWRTKSPAQTPAVEGAGGCQPHSGEHLFTVCGSVIVTLVQSAILTSIPLDVGYYQALLAADDSLSVLKQFAACDRMSNSSYVL